ncbi:hypothetical protein GGR56DRAFT_616514 [Xylariaceae sp. FL0804]|nr:hypothetical protein GGR56DRAFT_616514 [Xylariaceae sp. FL0804]
MPVCSRQSISEIRHLPTQLQTSSVTTLTLFLFEGVCARVLHLLRSSIRIVSDELLCLRAINGVPVIRVIRVVWVLDVHISNSTEELLYRIVCLPWMGGAGLCCVYVGKFGGDVASGAWIHALAGFCDSSLVGVAFTNLLLPHCTRLQTSSLNLLIDMLEAVLEQPHLAGRCVELPY